MPTERLPNLFIVGAQKSGTSALAGWLRQHPQVCMSLPKEPGYLAFGEDGYVFPDGYGRPAPATRYVVRDEQSYRALFAEATDAQKVIGEASTWYLSFPGMPQKLKRYNPQSKIIVIFRNPVERAYSAWCHARGADVEPCATLAAALELEAERGEPEHLLRYRRMGLYSQDLENYQREFPADQLLVLFYDDMRTDPEGFWQRVCRFLDIDAAVEPPYEHRYNRSGKPRSKSLQNLMRSHKLKRAAKSILPYWLVLRIRGKLDDINLEQFPPMDDATRDDLKNFYREDVLRLQQITGRHLEHWLE